MTVNTRVVKQMLWFEHIINWEASKINQRQFCDTQQLNIIQFGYWLKKYRQQHKTATVQKQSFITLPSLPVQP